MVEAVVFDIGGVLEIIDDAVFPEPWCQRHGVPQAALTQAFGTLPSDPAVGGMSLGEIRSRIAETLGLSDPQSDDLWVDYWRWYVGELDRPLFEWFAGVRSRGLKAAILSNSGPGAREAERMWGFEQLVDVLIYSHEVGLQKPDPRIYELTARELDVPASQIVFVDDWIDAIDAARVAGWRAIHHTGHTPATIAALEEALHDHGADSGERTRRLG